MKTRIAPGTATVATLALTAALGLSACTGSGLDGTYIPMDDADGDSSVDEIFVIHDEQVSQVEYRGGNSDASCEAFKRFISDAEDNKLEPEIDDVYTVHLSGRINDAGDTIVWEEGNGATSRQMEPQPLQVDTPDTGMLTVDVEQNTDIWVPAKESNASQSIEHTQTEECSDD